MLNAIQTMAIELESASWIKDAIRSVFWLLAKGILFLLDGIFLIIDDIWKFKFFDNPYVNKIYSSAIIVACTWLVLKVIIDLIMRYFVDQEDNSSPTKVFKGIVFAIMMMFLIPPVFNWGYDLSSNMTQYVVSESSNNAESPTTIESSMSSMILTAFADNDKMEEDDKDYFIENWASVDYNEVTEDGLFNSGKYIYSFNTFTIFLVGLVVVVLMFFIGIQVAKRIIELALYKSIAPFVCTSLVSNKSNAFGVWLKGVIGTFIVTTVQYLCIGILFNVYGQVADNTTYTMSAILIIIGALLFIISSPQLVSALLNANTGATANMSELHSIAALGTSMIAMSKYGKTVDNSSSVNSSNDNSTSNNNDSGFSNNTDSGINSNNSSSNLSNSDHTDSKNNSESNVGNTPKYNDVPNNNSNSMDQANVNGYTSLSDRIDTYNDIIDNNYSYNDTSVPTFKTNVDWGENNVSDTKKY